MSKQSRTQSAIFSWTPRPWQQEIIDGQKRITAIRTSRQIGKTELCSYLVDTALLSSPTKLEVAICSFSLKNARGVIWQRVLDLLHPFPPFITHIKSQDMMINEQTGSVVRLHGLSKEHGDSIRGFSYDMLVIDEYALVPYEIFVSAAMPTLSARNGWLLAITTPRGSGFDLMAMLENECRDPQNISTHALFHFPASALTDQINHLTPKFLAEQKKRNPLAYALEYEADNKTPSQTNIFDVDLLQHALTINSPVTSPSLAVSAGLDFAPRRDRCVMAIRNYRNFIDFIQLDYNQDPYGFVNQIKDIVHRYNIRFLTADRGGAGEVIGDMLENTLSDFWPIEDVRAVLSGEKPYHSSNYNVRAECYAMLRDYLSHAPNTVPNSIALHQQFLNELSATNQKPNDSGKFQIIGKQDIIEVIGNSPDLADAAALSMYHERYTQSWQKPVEELTHHDISMMSNREILDTFAEYYE